MGPRGNGLRESFQSAGLSLWTRAPGDGMPGHSPPRRAFTSSGAVRPRRRPADACPGPPSSSNAADLRASTRNSAWTRSSPVSSGWNDVPSTLAWRTITPWPSRSASVSTSGPVRSIHGARMNTAGNGSSPSAGIVERDLRRVDLAAERVAAHGDVEQVQRRLLRCPRRRARRRSCPCTCPRTACRRATRCFDRLGQPEAVEQPDHRRRLAAGNDERVDAREIVGRAHFDDVRARALERVHVLDDVALQRQHADGAHLRRLRTRRTRAR